MGNNRVEHTLNKVVFLDRDGTLNEEVNYLHKTEDMKLLPGVPQALKKLKDAGYKLIVVTNQAGVARGYYTEDDVKNLHQYMNQVPVDKAASYMIGDKLLDTEAGQRFGVASILVGTGYGAELHKEAQEKDEKPPYDHYADTLEEAAQWILEKMENKNQ